MTAKEYLSQLKTLHAKINQKIKEADELRLMAESVGSVSVDGDKVKTSLAQSSRQHNMIDKRVDLQAVIDSEIDKYVDLKHKIINEVHQLENARYVELLYLHYVPDENGAVKRLEEIAELMRKTDGDGYSYQYIKELHGEALKDFEMRVFGDIADEEC